MNSIHKILQYVHNLTYLCYYGREKYIIIKSIKQIPSEIVKEKNLNMY